MTAATATPTWRLTRHAAPLGLTRLPGGAAVPPWALGDGRQAPLWSLTRTEDELSVICAWQAIPGPIHGAGPFTAFSVDGPLDHTLVGVLAGLLAPLAEAQVSILAESTFDTDWILVPSGRADTAVAAWEQAGHTVHPQERA